MTDVFDVLGKDHTEVKAMLETLEAGPTAGSGASPEQLEQRKRLTDQVVIEESRHETAEQQYFWPAVRALGAEGERIAEQALGQEQEAAQVLDKLDKAGSGDPEFEGLLTGFISDAREHIAFEEGHAWPLMRKTLSAEQATQLGEKITKAKESAPTRPHPRTPPDEKILKTAGPAVAAADKMRDAMSDRGTE